MNTAYHEHSISWTLYTMNTVVYHEHSISWTQHIMNTVYHEHSISWTQYISYMPQHSFTWYAFQWQPFHLHITQHNFIYQCIINYRLHTLPSFLPFWTATFHLHISCVAPYNPYPTAFPYGNGMVLHFYQQQESSTTKTVHKVINKGLKTYV